jgi:hypothetical protein
LLNLSIEDKLILAAARLNPSDEEIRSIEELISTVDDWEFFTSSAIRNSVGPLVYKNFTYVKNYSSIPESAISKLKQTYYISFNRNEAIYKSFRIAVKALSEKDKSVIALKGIFLVDKIYHDIGLRHMSDIDLLVKKEDAESCRNILIGIGFETKERFKSEFIRSTHDTKHLPQLVKDNVSIELHLKTHTDDCEYNVNVDDYWRNAVNTEISKTACLALSPTDLLQHLCLHLDYHFKNGKIQLYSYCDISEVLKFYKDEISWDAFEQSCNKYNCSKNVFLQIYIAHKYFAAPLPEHMQKKASDYADEQSERLFISYLKGNEDEISNEIANSNIKKLKQIKGTGQKLKYLLDDLFPSAAFMRSRYKIKNKSLLYWYYIIRLKTGIAGLFRHLTKTKKTP